MNTLFNFPFDITTGDYGWYANFNSADHSHRYVVSEILKKLKSDTDDGWESLVKSKFPGRKIQVKCVDLVFPEFQNPNDLMLFVKYLENGTYECTDKHFINLSYLIS